MTLVAVDAQKADTGNRSAAPRLCRSRRSWAAKEQKPPLHILGFYLRCARAARSHQETET
jgi:hypothetical protein